MSSEDSEDEVRAKAAAAAGTSSKRSKKSSKRSKKSSKHEHHRRHKADKQDAAHEAASSGSGDSREAEGRSNDKKSKKTTTKKKKSRKKGDKKHKKSSRRSSTGGGSGSGSGSGSSNNNSSGSSSNSESGNDDGAEMEDPFDTGITKINKPFDGFYVMCSGQVESAEFYGVDNLYCKYTFYYGQHWTPVAGVETAVSQISRKGREQSTVVTWNFPLEVTFRASNAHGWPRIVLSVYSIDMFGRDVVRGYGSLPIPPFAGQYVRYCRVFKPRSSSAVQSVLAWLTVRDHELWRIWLLAAVWQWWLL